MLRRRYLLILMLAALTLSYFIAQRIIHAQRLDDFVEKSYVYVVFSQPIPESIDTAFEIKTNNCGSPEPSKQIVSRSREFTIQGKWQFTEALLAAIGTQLGGEIGPRDMAKLQVMLENKAEREVSDSNGIDMGYSVTVGVEREIITPPFSRSTVLLQWEEIRMLGTVVITNTEGLQGDSPFYIVRDLNLTQINYSWEECGNSPLATVAPTARTTVTGGTSTRVPPTPVTSSIKPRLIAPTYGQYQNPVNFSWDGSDRVLYQVTLIHRDQNHKHTSEWIQGFFWSYQLPAEQYGNWDWYVVAKDGVSSDIWSFIFNPFPGSSQLTPTLPSNPPSPPATEPTVTPVSLSPPTSYPAPTTYP